MKKIYVLAFFLSFLTACQMSTSKTTITADNFKKEPKAKVTFSGGVNNGICINCSQ